MKHVYVAGPISSDPIGCSLIAMKHASELLDAGLFPFIPHLTVWWGHVHKQDYETWMRFDFAWIKRCDALLRIPGHSPGADREIAFAKEHGIPVFYIASEVIAWARAA